MEVIFNEEHTTPSEKYMRKLLHAHLPYVLNSLGRKFNRKPVLSVENTNSLFPPMIKTIQEEEYDEELVAYLRLKIELELEETEEMPYFPIL